MKKELDTISVCLSVEQEVPPIMSYCVCLVNGNGFVMASDSRSTVLGKDGRIDRFDDSFQKVAYLPKSELGVIVAGQNTVNGRELLSWIKKQDSVICGITPREKCEDLRSKLSELNLQLVNICMASVAIAPESYYFDIADRKATPLEKNQRFWDNNFGIRPSRELYTDQDGELAVNVQSMNLRTMAGFAAHLIRTGIEVSRFRADLQPVVGGSIQILAVDCDGEVVINTNSRK